MDKYLLWNGVKVRDRSDPLGHALQAVVILLADRGVRIRWSNEPDGFTTVRLLVDGVWYECVPPPWKMSRLIERMARCLARNWLDWWRLSRERRRHVRFGEPLAWDRNVVLTLNGSPIPAVCRLRANGANSELELELTTVPEEHSLAARSLIQDWSHRATEEVEVDDL